jgi:succinate dehydrogenase / fumarate reductase, flavoprotein subunit
VTLTRTSNVLVVGTGAAGLRAAIAAHDAGASVIVLAKRGLRDAHTVLAAGGINAALATRDPEDRWERHFADTLREGYFLGIPRMVEVMCREAPAAVLELAEWGCRFARMEDGGLDQRFFGAHTFRRTCYAGDHTGRDIIQTLAARAESLGIPIVEHQYVWDLLIEGGECRGALAFDLQTGRRTEYRAGAVILCTGGHTSLWLRNTSRREENLGEGMALALRAGCTLMDMEFVQFHPTGLVAPEDVSGTLVTEAVRGEGGRLYNSLGERFMERYDWRRMELSTRDRVALANYTEILAGRGGPDGGVFLDVSHLEKEYIKERLPKMYGQLLAFQGLDISQDPMEVAPTAHYSMGGIVVDPDSHATEVAGLFAAGECVSGLHGANRLGGNSLSDTLVFGRRAGESAAELARRREQSQPSSAPKGRGHEALDALIGSGTEDPRRPLATLRELMWEHCGVLRDGERLQEGLAKLGELREASRSIDARPDERGWMDLAHALDLRAAMDAAETTLLCALERRETRGAHNRSDHPDTDPALAVSIRIRLDPDTGRKRVERVPLPPVPEHLQEWVNRTLDIPEEGRLLE